MLWIFTQNEQSFVNVHEVTVTGKKIEGFIEAVILGSRRSASMTQMIERQRSFKTL